ncbi:Thiamine transporter thi9 [Ceratobasidium theobromae]|uniref:Thiamine transporter thi9 n=1 Tax=Ceratobasidium theobromae TaxID=1582974 RepID=A0A5N5Q8G4_9AGAM|nr:Thiamine transporter thi9 [Ceratobasidium theobromae]
MLGGGPLATWTSSLVSIVFMCITAAVLREICSALPISGSIYVWAMQAAGPRRARFVGCIVAWWITTTWITFTASVSQFNANYILSLVPVYDLEFPGGVSNDNVKWRAVVWFSSELLLLLAVLPNYLPPRMFSMVLRASVCVITLDFFLCIIWLPIGVSKTYGFRTAKEAFLTKFNGTGAPSGWNWMLSFVFASSLQAGFDAAGHVAEETKNASVVAAQSIFTSAVTSGIGGFIVTILFLFCTPDFDTLFSLNAPQPFVLIYTSALGRGGGTFMTVLAVVSALLSNCIVVLAASRLIFSIARDGTLPLSSWVSKVSHDGRPLNAVTLVYIIGALLLCTILPSTVAFFSLMSCSVLPLFSSYGVIALLRLVSTPNQFKTSKYSLGKFAKPLYIVTVLFHAVLFAVWTSPFTFPVSAKTLNFGPVIFGAVTIFGIMTWWFIPQETWLSKEKIEHAFEGAS